MNEKRKYFINDRATVREKFDKVLWCQLLEQLLEQSSNVIG